MFNRFELFDKMVNGKQVLINDSTGRKILCTIQSIEMEDGSGFNFNLRVYDLINKMYSTIFVRCER